MSETNNEITLESVEGRILSSLFHHNNFPAYDFQIADRINTPDIPEEEFSKLVKEGLVVKTSSYSLTKKGLLKVQELSKLV